VLSEDIDTRLPMLDLLRDSIVAELCETALLEDGKEKVVGDAWGDTPATKWSVASFSK
jgi:hypothetical protein